MTLADGVQYTLGDRPSKSELEHREAPARLEQTLGRSGTPVDEIEAGVDAIADGAHEPADGTRSDPVGRNAID